MSKIEFKDFPKSITTEEFLAVLEVVGIVNDNFEAEVVKNAERCLSSQTNLDKSEKEHGKYSKEVITARKIHRNLKEVLDENVSDGYSVFLRNYDGVIEFLTRFGLRDSVRKKDIKQFIKTKDKDE